MAGGVTASNGGRFGGFYGWAQTAILIGFTVAYAFSPVPPADPAATLTRVRLTAGALLCAAGLALLAASFASLGKAVQVDPEPRAGATLVTRGVYVRLRHPMYTAIVILAVGLWLRKPAGAVGAMTLAVIAILAVKVRYEERRLLARYPGYAAYRARTWGLFLTPPR